jgi:type IV pilus assembly protein PilX
MKILQNTRLKQKGSVLVLSLIMLVILTMLGVSSMSSSSLQEKMAGNFRDRQIAFQAAEAALAFAENYVNSDINSANLGNNDGYYNNGSGPTSNNAFTSTWWTGTNSKVLGTTINEVRTQPRFTIEARDEVGSVSGTSINVTSYGESTGGGIITSFRVTARGTGKSNNTVVILQTNYGKRL